MTDGDHDLAEEKLSGGGMAEVVRVGTTVRRPRSPWSPAVHRLLVYLRSAGFTAAPESLGVDAEGRDVFGYLAGEVGHYPWTAAVASDEALVSAAALLRKYHDTVAPVTHEFSDGWRFPAIEPVEVVCHNDFAPYNCVYDGPRVTGFFDFDIAVPGPRRWDLGYALYRFAPLSRCEEPRPAAEQGRRAWLFLDAYGISGDAAREALHTVIPRLGVLADFLRSGARDGDENFARHIAEGHLDLYLSDIAWVGDHIDAWTR